LFSEDLEVQDVMKKDMAKLIEGVKEILEESSKNMLSMF
jgi:hypothetical protein